MNRDFWQLLSQSIVKQVIGSTFRDIIVGGIFDSVKRVVSFGLIFPNDFSLG